MLRWIAAAFACALLATVAAPAPDTRTAAPRLTMSGTTWCSTYGPTVVIGDSQSSGQGASNWSHTWVAQLDAALPTAITKLAYNGAMTRDFLPGGLYGSTIDQIRAIRPALVIIGTGANEYLQDLGPIGEYRANLAKLIDLIKGTTTAPGASPTATILLLHTHGFSTKLRVDGNHAWSEYGLQQYQLATTRWAQQVRFADASSAMPWLEADDLGLYVNPEPDGVSPPVHMNDRGHAVLYAYLLGRLTSC